MIDGSRDLCCRDGRGCRDKWVVKLAFSLVTHLPAFGRSVVLGASSFLGQQEQIEVYILAEEPCRLVRFKRAQL